LGPYRSRPGLLFTCFPFCLPFHEYSKASASAGACTGLPLTAKQYIFSVSHRLIDIISVRAIPPSLRARPFRIIHFHFELGEDPERTLPFGRSLKASKFNQGRTSDDATGGKSHSLITSSPSRPNRSATNWTAQSFFFDFKFSTKRKKIDRPCVQKRVKHRGDYLEGPPACEFSSNRTRRLFT